MKKQIWTEEYKVASYLVNLRGQAGLHTILNFIQDVGWLHAIHLEVKLGENRGWIFTRQKLKMTEWPKWNETVSVRTWLRPPATDYFLLRDYEIFIGDRKIGECTSTFTVMDLENRKIAIQDWTPFSSAWRHDHQLDNEPGKIQIKNEMLERAQFQVRNSDIDLNKHVNNTKYAQWILDALPIQLLQAGVELKEYEVNFLAETKSQDVISVLQTSQDIPAEHLVITQFQGIRQSDNKPVFSAQMKVQLG